MGAESRNYREADSALLKEEFHSQAAQQQDRLPERSDPTLEMLNRPSGHLSATLGLESAQGGADIPSSSGSGTGTSQRILVWLPRGTGSVCSMQPQSQVKPR